MNKILVVFPVAIIAVLAGWFLNEQYGPDPILICNEPKINVENECVCPDGFAMIGNECEFMELDRGLPRYDDPCKLYPDTEGCLDDSGTPIPLKTCRDTPAGELCYCPGIAEIRIVDGLQVCVIMAEDLLP